MSRALREYCFCKTIIRILKLLVRVLLLVQVLLLVGLLLVVGGIVISTDIFSVSLKINLVLAIPTILVLVVSISKSNQLFFNINKRE